MRTTSVLLAMSISLLLLPTRARAQDVACPAGEIAAGPRGECCGPGQVWNTSESRCVDLQSSEPGFATSAPSLATVCPAGQAITADTAGHCCWPGQAWSSVRAQCVGAPMCPAGLDDVGGVCTAACPPGLQASALTEGHCCLPGEVWNASAVHCVGPAPANTLTTSENTTNVSLVINVNGAPPAAVATPTALTIISDDPALTYDVRVRTADGRTAACSTPCHVESMPGYLGVDVVTPIRTHADLTVGTAPVTLRLHHANHRGAIAVGSILTPVAIAGIASGVAVASSAPPCPSYGVESAECISRRDENQTLGIVIASIGGVLLPSGLITLLAGAVGSPIEMQVIQSDGTINTVATARPRRETRALRFAGFDADADGDGGGHVGVRFAF